MNALVVDDEESARKLMLKLLDETLFFHDIRMANSVDAAKKELAQFSPDLIFLDIRMPGTYGIEFVKELEIKGGRPGIVFVTAYDQYAIRAIKIKAFDYLLKPVNRKELTNCILNFRAGLEEVAPQIPVNMNARTKLSRVKVNTRTGVVFINPTTILYCRAEGNYTKISTGVKEYLCSLNLGKLHEQLPETGFIRIGRSLIVNLEYITLLDRKKRNITLERNNESVVVKIPHQHLRELDI